MLPGAIFFLFSTIFCNLILDFCSKTRTRFSLRDKRLFEITEVEIMRVDCMLKPNAFFRLEKDLLQMLRLACIFSCMAIVSKVFYIVILQRTDATPTDIVHLALLPIAAVIIYKILCLLVFVSRHVLRFLGFVMWTPFMILIGSPLFFFYLVLFAPTVWLYRVTRPDGDYGTRMPYISYIVLL